MPTKSCQRASTSPRSRAPSLVAFEDPDQRRPGRRRGRRRPGPRPPAPVRWRPPPRSWTRWPSAFTVPLSVRRAMSALPAASAARFPSQALRASTAAAGSMPSLSRETSGTTNSAGVPEALTRQHGPQVLADFGFRRRRDPVEHDRNHDVPGRRVQQQLPGDGVGVAVGGGDKDPQVGGRQQLAGQLAVVIRDGIDVRGIKQCHALRHRRVGHQDQRGDRRPRPARGRPGWPGTAAGTTTPRMRLRPGRTRWSSNQAAVRGMVQQYGLAGGGTDCPCPCHRVAHERVDER